ncbi:unnamed protein product [Cuscuta europaea]|uniref:Myb-like domain-containing protein n=1 Tax=Cuscuta europaea TaxID=41803 RepID=A0A9P1EMX2_CUSEU|nr:unnamed protein product [Cuscuta europaea]
MLPGEVEFDTRGKECKFSSYIINFSDINDMKELWKLAFEKGKARKAEYIAKRNCDLVSHHVETSSADEPAADEVQKEADEEEEGKKNHYHKREESIVESKEDCRGEPKKKPRLNWNADMHQRFVQAIQKLGYDKAVPKKIVELMNEPGLTREHVASHLQVCVFHSCPAYVAYEL